MFSFLSKLFSKKEIEKPKSCQICGAIPPEEGHWTNHVYPPHFSFTWCDDCHKNRYDECEDMIYESAAFYLKR